MDAISLQVFPLLERQHGTVATWQVRGPRKLVHAHLRRLRRLFRGVYAAGDVSERAWYMAAALAMGPTGAVSHLSALQLLGLRPYEPGPIHVSHYRALEEADRRGYRPTLPPSDVVRLQQAVRGTTRSDAEAQLLILCDQHGITLPLVNHRVNGIEADFHWPEQQLILEVDGWAFHNERPQFEEDRRRELVHAAAGWQVVRASAAQVMTQPELVVGALQTTGW
jgi:very-short-patch-repair endonuclease